MIELKKPNIKGTTDYEKIEELRRYLFSLVEDLQFVLGESETRTKGMETSMEKLNTRIKAIEEKIENNEGGEEDE